MITKFIDKAECFDYVNPEYNHLDVAAPSSQQPAFNNGWSIDQITGRMTAGFTGGLDLGGNSIQNVSAIMSASGKWRIDEDGNLVMQNLEVRGKGITVYDEDTGQPVCVKSKNLNITATPGFCTSQTTQNKEITP